jgi:hypothetical protein
VIKSVILTVSNNQKNIVQSVVSVLESTIRPDNLCLVFSSATDSQWETSKAFFKSCCSGGYDEEYTNDATIISKKDHGLNLIGIKLNKLFDKELKNYGVNYLYNSTDVFFTLTAGTEYKPNFIETCMRHLEEDMVGACYSDYIENNKYSYLSSMKIGLDHQIPVKEIAFKKAVSANTPFKTDNFNVLAEFYARSVIRHIPEALFVA